jgi:hypothetical protein
MCGQVFELEGYEPPGRQGRQEKHIICNKMNPCVGCAERSRSAPNNQTVRNVSLLRALQEIGGKFYFVACAFK